MPSRRISAPARNLEKHRILSFGDGSGSVAGPGALRVRRPPMALTASCHGRILDSLRSSQARGRPSARRGPPGVPLRSPRSASQAGRLGGARAGLRAQSSMLRQSRPRLVADAISRRVSWAAHAGVIFAGIRGAPRRTAAHRAGRGRPFLPCSNRAPGRSIDWGVHPGSHLPALRPPHQQIVWRCSASAASHRSCHGARIVWGARLTEELKGLNRDSPTPPRMPTSADPTASVRPGFGSGRFEHR